jgi:adenylate kinase
MGRKKNKEIKALCVLGPPNSGKGTQSKKLAEKLGFFHFITSKIGKEWIETHDDAKTKEQKERYGKGLLFDPAWLFNVVITKTKEIAGGISGIIYDGSPRTLFEAEKISEFWVDNYGLENFWVVYLDVSVDELRRRFEKRLVCDKDPSHVFIRGENLRLNGACPESGCGGILLRRDLDVKEVVDTRFRVFKEQTLPGAEYLKKHYPENVIVINGERPIDDVYEEILFALRERGFDI